MTPLILTFNEQANLGRTLEKLGWAKEIVVVDSFSTDGTMEIARSFANVRVVQRAFDNHTAQWNYGLDQCSTDWVLSLDADYVLSPEVQKELESFQPSPEFVAYQARFAYCVHGKPLRATLYPPRAVLFRKDCARYVQDGHTQVLRIKGTTGWLRGRIFHDDRKPLSHWLWAQERYARLEVEKLLSKPASELRIQDRIRRGMVFAPALVFFMTLAGKGLIMDGWRGWFYVLQRTYAEILLALYLLERRLLNGKLSDRKP